MPANQPYDKTPCRSAYGTHPTLAPSATFLADLLRRKPRQHAPITPARAYNANALPILYPLESASIYGSYEPTTVKNYP